MAEVVEMKEFRALASRFDAMDQEFQFLREVVSATLWLSSKQVMAALGVSKPTLIALRRNGKLGYRQENSRFFYDVNSIRIYLSGKKIEPYAVNQIVINAIKGV